MLRRSARGSRSRTSVVTGLEHVVDAKDFADKFGPVLRQLGPERLATIFSRHPGVIARVGASSYRGASLEVTRPRWHVARRLPKLRHNAA